MAERDLLPREYLSMNLKALMAERPHWSQAEAAKRAGVDPKTFGNYLKGEEYDPRPDLVNKIAHAFGVKNGWLLLSKYFRPNMGNGSGLDQILTTFAEASPESRDNILRVAEMAAQYKRK